MLNGARVLIVEDDDAVAMVLAERVARSGGTVLGPMATVTEALDLLNSEPVAAAILDCHLVDQDVSAVALRLIQLRVPMVIYTGSDLPPPLNSWRSIIPVISKPASPHLVVARLDALLMTQTQMAHVNTADGRHGSDARG